MGVEIERKFLVVSEDWRGTVERGIDYRQGYLVGGPPLTLRARIGDGQARLNIKIGGTGIEREEYEYPIPVADAETMLSRHAIGSIIDKRRHVVVHAGMRWEIDEFRGDNAGLVVAEIELDRADQPFERPPWLGDEVSGDARYYNASLTARPFGRWGGG